MIRLRYVLCDVFTDRPLQGNPLAVFTDASGIKADTMQALAREMNLSETVFVLPARAGGQARLRIFTPTRELPFAGHPVLGAAFVIGDAVQLDVLSLETERGVVPVHLVRRGARSTYGWMEQPLPALVSTDEPSALLAALGVEAPALAVARYDNGLPHAIVVLQSPDAVDQLRPDAGALARVAPGTVCVAARRDPDWYARVFAPGCGVFEDPATGSAAGPLALHLARSGWIEFAQQIHIHQGVALGRPSQLSCAVFGTRDAPHRVEVGGGGVLVARGEFRIAGS